LWLAVSLTTLLYCEWNYYFSAWKVGQNSEKLIFLLNLIAFTTRSLGITCWNVFFWWAFIFWEGFTLLEYPLMRCINCYWLIIFQDWQRLCTEKVCKRAKLAV
jgi:hypothetical protein